MIEAYVTGFSTGVALMIILVITNGHYNKEE